MEKIDWQTELRKIEREFDGLPPEPTPEQLNAKRVADQREKQANERSQQLKQERYTILGVWARAVLVAVLAVAVSFWPYSHACGFGLFAYMFVGVVIVVGSVWASFYAWHYRMAQVHILAQALLLWGLILLAGQVLPRTGYARVNPAHPPIWLCR